LTRERLEDTAERLHAVAIHLLRRLRKVDQASGLSGPRLSALSVVVFAGPLTLTQLAAAEQVKPPTMTRLVQALQREGLVRRLADPKDGRVAQVAATAKGRHILLKGRERRVAMLVGLLSSVGPRQQAEIANALGSLEEVARTEGQTG